MKTTGIMEFEKGKYYEMVNCGHIEIAKSTGYTEGTLYDAHTIYMNHEEYDISELATYEYPWMVNRIFKDIQEVSARIKEIEAEKEKGNSPVKVGQIWEVKKQFHHFFIKVSNDIHQKNNKACYWCEAIMLKKIKHTVNEGNYIECGILPKDSNYTLLTQAQYEQRINELEEGEFKVGDWIKHPQDNSQIGIVKEFYPMDKSWPYKVSWVSEGGFTDKYSVKSMEKITEQEAIKLLTGKDYVELHEGKGLYPENEMQKYRDEIENLKKEVNRLSKLSYDRRHDRERLREENEKLKENITTLEQNAKDWINRYDLKEKQLKKLERVLEEKEATISNFQTVEKNLRAELQELKGALQVKDDHVAACRKRTEALKAENESLQWLKQGQKFFAETLIHTFVSTQYQEEQVLDIIYQTGDFYGHNPTQDQTKEVLKRWKSDESNVINGNKLKLTTKDLFGRWLDVLKSKGVAFDEEQVIDFALDMYEEGRNNHDFPLTMDKRIDAIREGFSEWKNITINNLIHDSEKQLTSTH